MKPKIVSRKEINNQEINNQEINNQEINNQEINNQESELTNDINLNSTDNNNNQLTMKTFTSSSNNFSTTHIDDLPEEMLLLIFKFLNLNDLDICRQVCRKFHFLCDQIKISEVVCYDGVIYKRRCAQMENNWFKSKKRINYRESIKLIDLRRKMTFFKLDQHLQRLHINIMNVNIYHFKPTFLNSLVTFLNSLTHLVELEISLQFFLFGERILLRLANLNVLELNSYNSYNRIKMDSPKLTSLCCNNLNCVELVHPETVRNLTIYAYDDKLLKFKNLEYLDCASIASINREIVSILKQLKTLICSQVFHSRDNLIETMSFIIKQKLVLRRTELKIYLQGIRLDSANELNSFDFDLKNTRLQIEKYNDKKLCSYLPFVKYVDYTVLVNMMKPKKVPAEYFNKFYFIQEINVTEPVNENDFVFFIRQLYFVYCLRLFNSSLSQMFYDNLPNIADLEFLKLYENEELSLNLEFILKFRELRDFWTNLSSQDYFNLTLKAFKNLQYLRFFEFRFNEEAVKISSFYCSKEFGNMKYNLTCYRDNQRTFSKEDIKFNELVTYFNHLTNRTKIVTRRIHKLTNRN